MTQFDDRLRHELSRRATTVEAGRDWAKQELLPGVLSGIETRRLRVPASRVPAFAGLAGAVAIVLVLVIALPRVGPGTSPPPGSGPSSIAPSLVAEPDPQPVQGVASRETPVGEFSLTITAALGKYSVGEPIDVGAELVYEGPRDSVVIGTIGTVINGFGIAEVNGPRSIEPEWPVPCQDMTMERGVPQAEPFSKSGGWSPDDPDADFYQQYFADPELRLPEGRWRISAYSEFWAGSCSGDGGPYVRLNASVEVTVGDATAVTTPQPSTPPPSFTCDASVESPPNTDPQEDRLPTIVDETGLVESCEVVAATTPNETGVWVTNMIGDNTTLHVEWSGNPCDVGSTFTFGRSEAGYGLDGQRPVVACDEPLIRHAMRIHLTSAVQATSVIASLRPEHPVPDSPAPSIPVDPVPTPNVAARHDCSELPVSPGSTLMPRTPAVVDDETALMVSCEYSSELAEDAAALTITNPRSNPMSIVLVWAGVCEELRDFRLQAADVGYELSAFNPTPANVICDGVPIRYELRLLLSEFISAQSLRLSIDRPPGGAPLNLSEVDCADAVAVDHYPIHSVAYDTTGLVRSCQTVPGAQSWQNPTDPQLDHPTGDLQLLRVSWLGGACDLPMRIHLDRTAIGYEIWLDDDAWREECIALGVPRGVQFELSEPVAIEQITVRRTTRVGTTHVCSEMTPFNLEVTLQDTSNLVTSCEQMELVTLPDRSDAWSLESVDNGPSSLELRWRQPPCFAPVVLAVDEGGTGLDIVLSSGGGGPCWDIPGDHSRGVALKLRAPVDADDVAVFFEATE